MKNEMIIGESTTLEELLTVKKDAITTLARHGLHTLSCPGELYCPLKCVADSRDIPLEHLISDLNRQIA